MNLYFSFLDNTARKALITTEDQSKPEMLSEKGVIEKQKTRHLQQMVLERETLFLKYVDCYLIK